MQWFKHYHNADTSHKLALLIENHGKIAYAEYWLLLELLCEKYQGDEVEILVTEGELCRKLRKPFPKKMKTFLESLQNLSILDYKVFKKTFKFETRILWELKQKDFKRARHESDNEATETLLRDKREEIRDKREEYTPTTTQQENFSAEPLEISEKCVLETWEALGHKVKGYALTRKQLKKLIELNKIMDLEKYKESIDRLSKDSFYLNSANKSIDMIISEEILIRSFQKPNASELREAMIDEN